MGNTSSRDESISRFRHELHDGLASEAREERTDLHKGYVPANGPDRFYADDQAGSTRRSQIPPRTGLR